MKPDTPLYVQIANELETAILSGRMKPGQALPPVRELAVRFQVNANTAQKAVAELKRTGLIENQRRGFRTSVVSDQSEIESRRKQKAAGLAGDFIAQMKLLGYTDAEINTLTAEHP